jgi:hypothetical protein
VEGCSTCSKRRFHPVGMSPTMFHAFQKFHHSLKLLGGGLLAMMLASDRESAPERPVPAPKVLVSLPKRRAVGTTFYKIQIVDYHLRSIPIST